MSNYNDDDAILNDILSTLNNQESDLDNIIAQGTTDVQSQNAPPNADGNFNKTVDPNTVSAPQQDYGRMQTINRAPITVGRGSTQSQPSQYSQPSQPSQTSQPSQPSQRYQCSFDNTQHVPSRTPSRRPSTTMTETDNYPHAQRRSSSGLVSEESMDSSQDSDSVTSSELDRLIETQPSQHVDTVTNNLIAKNMRFASVDRQISVDSSMKDDQIAARLASIQRFLPNFVMKGQRVKSAFYNIMAVVQKMYIDNLPFNEEVTVSKNANGIMDTDVRSVSNASLIDLIKGILGPSPERKSSVRKTYNVVKINNVISVGNTVCTTDSKLFYCILKSSTDIMAGCFISYAMNVRVTDSTSDVFYRLRKYTDRPYLRYLLSNCGFDEITKELYCFILENIHMLAFHPKYLIQTDDYVIFDVYSLVTNIKHFYYTTDNYIDYKSINVMNSEYRTNRMNRTLPDIAVCTVQGNVNNSTTFAYAFWLYEFKYLALNYIDNTWFRELVRNGPVTSIDSNLDALCTYQIQAMNDPRDCMNIMTIDSDIQLMSMNECQTKHDNRMKGDLKVFYDRTTANNQAAITTYLDWVAYYLGKEAEKTEYDLFYIYPLVFYTCTKDQNIVLNFLNRIKGVSELERRQLSVATLPIYKREDIVKVSQPVVDTAAIKRTEEVKAMLKKIESTIDTTRTHNAVSKVCSRKEETVTPTKDKPRTGLAMKEQFPPDLKKKFKALDKERAIIDYTSLALQSVLEKHDKADLKKYIKTVSDKNSSEYKTWKYSTLHKNDIDYRLSNMKRLNTEYRLFIREYDRKYPK